MLNRRNVDQIEMSHPRRSQRAQLPAEFFQCERRVLGAVILCCITTSSPCFKKEREAINVIKYHPVRVPNTILCWRGRDGQRELLQTARYMSVEGGHNKCFFSFFLPHFHQQRIGKHPPCYNKLFEWEGQKKHHWPIWHYLVGMLWCRIIQRSDVSLQFHQALPDLNHHRMADRRNQFFGTLLLSKEDLGLIFGTDCI